MRTAPIITALIAACRLSAARPAPAPVAQLDADFFDAIPDPVVSSAPIGTAKAGPTVDIAGLVSDTVDDINDTAPDDADDADGGSEKSKRGKRQSSSYTQIFTGARCATESSYLTYKTIRSSASSSLTPTSADVASCEAFCDKVTGCVFANLYVENNAQGNFLKCSIFSVPSTIQEATNCGQDRDNYHVTISQSSGYAGNNGDLSVDGFTYECYGDKVINVQNSPPDLRDPYMGVSFLTTSPVVCAEACNEKTAYNSRHPADDGSYRACNFFNFYYLYLNGVASQTVCTFYIIPFDSSYATNTGYTNSKGTYTHEGSCGYTRVPQQGTGGIISPSRR